MTTKHLPAIIFRCQPCKAEHRPETRDHWEACRELGELGWRVARMPTPHGTHALHCPKCAAAAEGGQA